MTAPILQRKAADSAESSWVVQFIMPAEYTFDSLPQPLDDRMVTRQLPQAVFAAIRFTGLARRRTLERRERILRELLAERQAKPSAETFYAFYDSPLTPPPLRRNEVLIEIEAQEKDAA
jgi:hypothetical protein